MGDSIPNEIELSSALGVARSVLREALSRLKMMGMIESRTRRGMILTEPFILGGMKRVVDPPYYEPGITSRSFGIQGCLGDRNQ